jgi:hypothetical protein
MWCDVIWCDVIWCDEKKREKEERNELKGVGKEGKGWWEEEEGSVVERKK